jgi:hypothetical protein
MSVIFAWVFAFSALINASGAAPSPAFANHLERYAEVMTRDGFIGVEWVCEPGNLNMTPTQYLSHDWGRSVSDTEFCFAGRYNGTLEVGP